MKYFLYFFSLVLLWFINAKWISKKAKDSCYNCNKCKVFDCPGKKCIKKSKYFIIPIILISLFTINVNAAVQNTWFKVNDSLLLPNNYLGASAGNQNFSVNYDGYPDNLLSPTSPWFVSVVLCVDNAGTSIYSNNTAVTDINVNVTNFKCYYPGSSYLGGKVTILNYKNSGGGSYNNTKFTWYLNDYSSFALIDFKVSLDSWVVAQNYANITSIVNQQEFLNQNNEIKNSITSDDSDISSNKCGIICKLKGIFTGIANLPSKIGDLLKSLFIPSDEQMSDLLNDTQSQLNSKLGILGLPTSIYTQFLNLLTSDVNENTCIQFDNIKDPVYDQLLIGSSSFCFNTLLQNEKLNTFRTSCLLIVGGLLLLAFVSFLKKQYNRILDINDPDENYEYITSEDSYNIDYSTGEVTGMKHNERKTRRNKL